VFHIPTLTVCLAATVVIVSGFLILLWTLERDNRALGFWSLGFSVGALGMVLVSLRDVAPPIVALGFGNALGIYSLGLIWLGCMAFEGETRKGAGFIAAAGAIFWLCLFAFPAFATDLGTRVLVASVLYAAYSFLPVPVLLLGQRREPLPARMIAVAAFAAHGACYLIRLPLQMIEPAHLEAGHGPLWYGILTFGFFVQGLIGALAVFAMVHERATRRYKHESETDGLTSLLNRRAFIKAVGKARSGLVDSAPGAVLALVDADHFKSINDTYGHGAGDAVLADLGRFLIREAPESALVGRLGGEEFGVYLPADMVLSYPHFLDELRLGVSGMTIQHEHELPGLTVSIGAVSLPSGPLDFSRALAQADKALYTSKKAGRNRVTWAGVDSAGQDRRDVGLQGSLPDMASVTPRSAA
nr:GGDEF domain-containing protein [Rhizobium sp.]